MKYLVLPLVLLIGCVELILRAVLAVVLACTIIGIVVMLDHGALVLTPISFKVAEKIID